MAWTEKQCQVPEVVVSSENTDGLEGFTQTHVITQDSMQLVLIQEGQPVHSILVQRENAAIFNTTSRNLTALPYKPDFFTFSLHCSLNVVNLTLH